MYILEKFSISFRPGFRTVKRLLSLSHQYMVLPIKKSWKNPTTRSGLASILDTRGPGLRVFPVTWIKSCVVMPPLNKPADE